MLFMTEDMLETTAHIIKWNCSILLITTTYIMFEYYMLARNRQSVYIT